jgi:ubiquitin-protein ligase E3 C
VLSRFFLRKLLGRANTFDDLASLDDALHRSLVGLLHMPPGEVAGLGLTMTVAEDSFGSTVTTPLVPGGEEVEVTGSNVAAYVAAFADHKLNASIAAQTAAFLRGFRELIPVTWMRMFGPSELRLLLCGSERPIDLADLRAHTVYQPPFHDDHPYIHAFWRVVESFDDADRRAFLSFVTSCPRAPLLGFGAMKPRFGISRVPIASDADKLPTASTCMALLKLPCPYSSDAVLRDKLLYAVRSGAGFELT